MKKREREYLRRRKNFSFLMRIANAVDMYSFAQLKIQQLRKGILIGKRLEIEELELQKSKSEQILRKEFNI